jgi:hypothetical protein
MDALIIKTGRDQTLNFKFANDNGTAINLTGATVYVVAKSDAAQADAAALFARKITSHATPLQGITTTPFTAAQTSEWAPGNYVMEVTIKDSADKLVDAGETKLTVRRAIMQEAF